MKVGVLVDLRLPGRGVGDGQGEAYVRSGIEEHPVVIVHGTPVEHFDHHLRIVLAEEPERPSGRQPQRFERYCSRVAGKATVLTRRETRLGTEAAIARLVVDADLRVAWNAGATEVVLRHRDADGRAAFGVEGRASAVRLVRSFTGGASAEVEIELSGTEELCLCHGDGISR